MKILKFNEKNLALDDLSNRLKTGELRGNVLINKIKDNEDLIFKPKSGKSITTKISNVEEVIPNISDVNGYYDVDKATVFFKKSPTKNSQYKKVLRGENGETYQLNDLEKTVDFGSSGGSSLGTKETINVECIQCLFLALRQTKGDISLNDRDIYQIFDEDGKIKQTLLDVIKVPIDITKDLIESHYNWIKSFVNTANALYEVRPIYTKDKVDDDNILSMRKTYIFYQIGYDGGLTKALSTKYRSFNETKGIPISKWTPSDIWVVNTTQHISVIRRITECENLDELNMLIDQLFSNKTLRGVSLKKLKNIKKTSDVQLIINKVAPVPVYRFDKAITSNNPMSSIGIKIISIGYVYLDSVDDIVETLDVRSFSGSNRYSDISGEVIGRSARHGKIGLVKINNILQKYKIDTILNRNKLIDFTDDDLLSEIKKMNDIILELGDVTKGNSNTEINRNRLISKYQSLKLATILYENIEVADNIVQEILYYAMSISNSNFISPKYVRII